ncbi:MAG: MFS transporter, partial [Planctomycetaceae bacterium]|nr:MFS transporter [Planctomycetaceae bacterium]
MQIKKIKIEQPENEDLEQYVPATARTSCWTRGFIALLITQFTVALNDNIFRWLIIPIGKHYINEDTARLLGGVFLVVPFIMFASMAGFMTDRFSRRSVMIWCKFVEIMLLLLGISVICFLPLSGVVKVTALLVVLFLLGTQATFFSPSKYGVIPDLVPQNQISNANGYLAMLTMIAIVAGQIIGGYLFAWTTLFKEIEEGGHKIKVIVGEPGTQNWFLTTSVLLGFALIGYVSSFFIPKFKPSASHVKFEKNIFKQTVTELRMLIAIRPLFYAALASSFFWGLAALSQTNIDKYACDFLMVKQEHVTPLAAILSFGIAGGSLLAGWLSRGRIELGMVPIGAFGMGIFAIFIGFTPPLPETVKAGFGTITSHSYLYGSIGLMLLGLMAGLYDVPLAAFLQKESPLEKRGRILAAYNFFSFSFMLAFSVFCFGLAMLFNTLPYTKAAASLWIWITIGILVIVVGVVMLRYLMLQFLEFIVRTFFRLVYRVEIRGEENIPREGGVLIVSNHVSFLDGLLLYAFCTRPVRYFAHDDYIKGFAANYVARKTGVMRIVPGKKSVIDAIKQAREALSKGEIVGIFPEGGLTRTGQIREFEPGYTSFLKGNEHVPILPVFIGGLFGSVFSYADRSRGFFSWPRRLRSQVVLEFGKPLPGDTPVHVLKHAVDEMAADSIKREQGKAFLPPCQWLRTFKKHRFSKYVQFADTLGTELSPRNFMISALVARRILRREVLARDVKKVAELKPMKGFWAYFNPIQYVFWRMLVVCHLARKIVVQREQNVAILTPPSVAGAIVNAALTLDCRTTTNLNYTFTADLLNFCL